MQEEIKEKGLEKHTVILMIMTALFFDALQWLMAFVLMDWLVGFFALLTFYVWLKTQGIKFTPKRSGTMFGGAIIEIIPVLSAFPAWTLAITIVALDAKIKDLIPV